MADQELINRFARAVKPTDSSTVWTPRAQNWGLHQGTITGVDVNNSVAHVQLNGDGTSVAEGVRFPHAYSADNPPAVGDTAWFHYDGRVALLAARQVVPPGPVVFLF